VIFQLPQLLRQRCPNNFLSSKTFSCSAGAVAEITEWAVELGHVAKHTQAPTPLLCFVVLALKLAKQWLHYTAASKETAMYIYQELNFFNYLRRSFLLFKENKQ